MTDVRLGVLRCERCGLTHQCRGPVPWEASKASHTRLAVIGEAPGQEEDRQGVPFVGPAGKLGRKWLKDVGIDPWVSAYLNVVSCYPHGAPTEGNIRSCRVNLTSQLREIKPEFCLIFGGVALGAVTGLPISIGEAHGWWWRMDEEIIGSGWTIWTTATYHPAAVLRGGAYTEMATMDLKGLASVMNRGLSPSVGEECVKCGDGVYMRRGDFPFCGKHWPKDPIKVTQEQLI